MISITKKFISQKDINNWQSYSTGLNNKAFVKKYLEAALKKWVEDIGNPLEITWVQWLCKDKLEKLDKILEKLEKKLGKENLTSIFDELKSEHGKAEAITIKIESLYGEITAFNKLTADNYLNLKKINQNGDWENDDVIISVKSILDLDLNYQLIENTIRGMIYIQENDILRKYNKIILHGEKKLDHKFRIKIIWFWENSLLNTLQFIDGELENNYNIEIKTTRFYIENGRPTGYLEICSSRDAGDSRITVEVVLREDRAGEEKLEHQLKIELGSEPGEEKTFSSIGFDTLTYWEGEQLDFDYLKRSIEGHLNKMDKNVSKIKGNKKFIGWINISIHPKYQCYISGNKQKIEEFVRTTKGDRQYKVVFCLKPQMGCDLKKAIIFDV